MMSNVTIEVTKEERIAELVELSETVQENFLNNRLTRVPMLKLNQLPHQSGVYLAVADDFERLPSERGGKRTGAGRKPRQKTEEN